MKYVPAVDKDMWDHPSNILEMIVNQDPFFRDLTFVIIGRTGPTGKTWLWEQLCRRGYKAVEPSEDLNNIICYSDCNNYFLIDDSKKTVLIVLNKYVVR